MHHLRYIYKFGNIKKYNNNENIIEIKYLYSEVKNKEKTIILIDITKISINVCNKLLVFKDLKSQNFENIIKVKNKNINDNPIFKSHGPFKFTIFSKSLRFVKELR